MKQILLKTWLIVVCLLCGAGTMWAETKTGSWDLTSSSSDWTASLNETYFSQPYGFKKANGTLTSKNISDFSTPGISQIKVGFKCLQNGGTTSKLTLYLVDKDGKTLGNGVVVTPDNKSAASQTTYKYATFTTNLTGATGFMMKVTTFGKNILINGAEYEVTYTSGPDPEPTNYTVTIANNIANGTVTADPTSATAGTEVTLTATPSTGYEFGSWNVTNASTSAAITVTANKFTMPAANVNVSATFNQIQGGGEEPGDEYTHDVLTNADFTATSTTYSDFSDVSKNTAVYAGNSAKNNGIQLRSSNSNSGIVSTTSGGKIKTVTVTWNSNCTSGRTIDVYGSNTAYTSAADLYNNTNQGTKLGSIVMGTSTSVTVTGDYAYVGIRSNSGALNIDNIDFAWEEGTPSDPEKTTPTLSFAEPTYNATMGEDFAAPTLTNEQNVTVSYASSAPGVATVNASTGAISLVAPGTTKITASFEGDETYYAASASYDLVVAAAPAPALTTMDEIYAKAKEVNGTETDVNVKLNNWVVSGVNGSNAYVTDGTKGFIIYKSGHNFVAGDILSGTVSTKIKMFNNAAEFTTITSTIEGLTVTKGGSVSEQSIAIADLAGVNTGALVAYKGLTYHLNGTSAEFSDGENVIAAYKGIMNALPELIEGKTYDVKGIFLMYGTKKEILPRSAEDIVLKENINNYIVTFDETLNGTITVKDGETVINNGDEVAEGTTLIIECAPANADYRFKNWQYKEGEDSWTTRYTATQDYTMPSANVQFRANFELIPTFTIYWSVNGAIVKTDENVNQGAALIAPEVSAINGKNFTGWVTTSTVDADATPDYVTPATPNTKEPSEITYYAVFASAGGTGGTATATLSIEAYADANSWKAQTQYITATFGDITAKISYTSTNQSVNTGKYYEKNQTITEDTWRIYQNEGGSITLSSSNGNIKSVIVNYFSKESGSGDNKKSPLFLYNESEVESGAKTTMDNASATFTVGGDGGNIQIYSIVVEYANGSSSYADFTTTPYLVLELDENSESIEEIFEEYDKVIVHRTIKVGNWNTLCLPFAMNATQIAENFGVDAEVKMLTGLTVNGDSYTMQFSDYNEIGAGLPCMIRVSKAVSTITVEGNVEVDTTEDPEDYAENGDDLVTFVGNYAKTTVPMNDGNYIISSNKFYYVDSAVTNKGFRGYFNLFSLDESNSSNRMLSFDFGGTITNIENINFEGLDDNIFDLQGRRVLRLQKGVNIVNGHKVIR